MSLAFVLVDITQTLDKALLTLAFAQLGPELKRAAAAYHRFVIMYGRNPEVMTRAREATQTSFDAVLQNLATDTPRAIEDEFKQKAQRRLAELFEECFSFPLKEE